MTVRCARRSALRRGDRAELKAARQTSLSALITEVRDVRCPNNEDGPILFWNLCRGKNESNNSEHPSRVARLGLPSASDHPNHTGYEIMRFLKHLTVMAMLAVGLVAQTTGVAQSFPSRDIRMIVPLSAGGPGDIIIRTIGDKLSTEWKQPLVVDNRPGANGNLGMALAARSPKDGYTLVLGNSAMFGVNLALYPKTGFDPIGDFEPVVALSKGTFYLGVKSELPINSVADLVGYAKANPGKLNFGSYGNGSAPHIAAEVLKASYGIDMTHVPYKGAAAALTALLSGEIQVLFDSSAMMSAYKNGAKGFRILASTSSSRMPMTPEVPTMGELGFGEFVFEGWYGIFAPKGTAPAITRKINADVNRILQMPETRSKLDNMNQFTIGGDSAVLRNIVATEIRRGRELVNLTGVKVE